MIVDSLIHWNSLQINSFLKNGFSLCNCLLFTQQVYLLSTRVHHHQNDFIIFDPKDGRKSPWKEHNTKHNFSW